MGPFNINDWEKAGADVVLLPNTAPNVNLKSVTSEEVIIEENQLELPLWSILALFASIIIISILIAIFAYNYFTAGKLENIYDVNPVAM